MSEFQPLKQLELLLGASSADRPVLFPPNSRYRDIETTITLAEDGTEIVHLRRRFVPQPEEYATRTRHTFCAIVDRLDCMAHKYLGDAELFWQICDANRVLHPDEIEQENRSVRIPLPPGMPAPSNDD